jgi:hypothetical protein
MQPLESASAFNTPKKVPLFLPEDGDDIGFELKSPNPLDPEVSYLFC